MNTYGIEMSPAEKAARLLKTRTTSQLISEFIMTGVMNDPHIPTVRGWYMDEFERRNPEAYNAWLEGPARDEDLYRYFA